MLSWGEFHGELICNRERQAKRLRDYLATEEYRRTLRAIQAYARMPSPKRKGSKSTPFEVRHVLPTLLHKQLSVVRAYDSRSVEFKASSLHRLRIEIKRLRYVITQFSGVLGISAGAFLVELKRMQDELGLLNDIDTARLLMSQLRKEKANVGGKAILEYLKFLRTREKSTYDEFMRTWRRFHTRRLQRQFSDALLVLR